MSTFDIATFDITKYNTILSNGLSKGMGNPNGQICIEAAVCAALGLPHGDDPQCVSMSVRCFKIGLNDKNWSSPEARAKGLYKLGLAQLGSLGVVNDCDFVTLLSKKIIQVLIPKLFRSVFYDNQKILDLVSICENEGTIESVRATYAATYTATYAAGYVAGVRIYAINAAVHAGRAAVHAANAVAANAAANAVDFTADVARIAANTGISRETNFAAVYAGRTAEISDEYLILVADLALEVLKDLKSPGCGLL